MGRIETGRQMDTQTDREEKEAETLLQKRLFFVLYSFHSVTDSVTCPLHIKYFRAVCVCVLKKSVMKRTQVEINRGVRCCTR